MLGWYLDLPAWIRCTIAVSVLVLGIALLIDGVRSNPPPNVPVNREVEANLQEHRAAGEFRSGAVVAALGAALLVLAPRTRAEKAGYRF